MPPKVDPKKGGEVIDLSAINTLPLAKTAIFQIQFSKFKGTEIRQKMTEHVTKGLPEERVKTLTRQEIIEYGKGRGIIVDAVPGESPVLSAEKQMAQSAADKLFEIGFAVRKSKKDKQARLEEEAAAKAAELGSSPATHKKPETDFEILDCLINMPDYPTTAKEHIAFSQYGQSINCFFEIFQIQENLDGTMPVDLKQAKEVSVSTEEAEVEHFNKFMEKISSLKSAIASSAKNAQIRSCAIFRVPFCNAELVDIKPNEEGGEPTTNILTAEQYFLKTFLVDYLEKYGAYFINYKKFKEQIELHQLMPDKEVMKELTELKRAHTQYESWRADREASKKEAADHVVDKNEGQSQEEKEELENHRQESMKNLESEMDTQKEHDIKNKDRIKQLLLLSKRSIDDERDKKTYFSDKIYKTDFIPDKETSNSIPSIMSAIVSQISEENAAHQISVNDVSTEPETLDDIFEKYQMEIAYETNLMEREIVEEEYKYQERKGVLPMEINVYETYDTSTKAIFTLPAGIHEDNVEHARKIAYREKEAARNLVLPGCNRFMMPDVPSKSKRLRASENPQFYPFSTLPVEDAERTMQLKALQQLIKSNGIDENCKPFQRLAKNKIFERKYEEYFPPDILRQVMQEALLMDPDVAPMYYPRTDQLLVILHNKIKNSKRTSENKEQPHCVKKWRSAYRVLPDFQNWIEFFGHNSVIQHEDYEPKDPSDPPVKFTLDEEMVPVQMLDIDNLRVKGINQTLNQFLPDDNSIMTSEEYEIGGVKRTKSIVYKDRFTFGIKEMEKKGYLSKPEEHGLVSYQNVGGHQFWLNFQDRETKLLVETVVASKNKQKMVEVRPPEPTPEELAAKEEAAKAAASAAAKAKGKGAPAAGTEAVVEEKAPQVLFQEMPPTFLDKIFGKEDVGQVTKGPCSTVTLKNGLIVRHMPNGDIVQIRDTSLQNQTPHTEVDRVYLKGGIVIRHFYNLDCEVLSPNGEFATFERATLKWTITNDKGYRREYQNGDCKDLPKINCLIQTDQGTGVETKVREDNVVMIKYKDGNVYCQHADGTQIFSQDDGNQTRIEKDGYAPIMYQATEHGEDLDDYLDTDELKSTDGMMTLAFLPDGCVVKSIMFYKSSEETDRQVIKHIYQREDFSCFMIDEDGDFRVISIDARAAINDEDERARLGTDSDYLKQMYQPNGLYTPSVYYGCLTDDPESIHLTVRDCDKPFCYRILHNSKLLKLENRDLEINEDYVVKEDKKNAFEADRDIEKIGIHKNPYTRSFIFPRIFIINPTGEGMEILSQDQIDQLIKFNSHKEDTLTTSRVEYIENTQMNSIQVMNKVTTIQEKEISNQKMDKLSFPEYSFPYIIPRKTEEQIKKLKPLQDHYQFRNITEYSSFEPLKQNSFIEDYVRFNEWKLSQVRYDSEFGIVHLAPKDGSIDLDEIEDIEFYAKRINLKIYKERENAKPPMSREVFKDNFVRAYNVSEEIVGFRKKMTTVEKEETEIAEAVEKRKMQDNQKEIEVEKMQKQKTLDHWREKKAVHTHEKVNERLKEYKDKKETPTFANQYHKSRAGVEYFKVHPGKPPTEEVLMRMSQRINRSHHATEKAQSIYDANSQKSGRSGGLNEKGNEDKDNPIVALDPDEHLKQASAERSKKYTSVSKHTGEITGTEEGVSGPSLYQQENIYLKQLDQEKVLKAEEHHVIKTKDFDVYGKLRQDKPYVKATQKSNAQSELNEKFITTECITDRRVKISSMANRQYINAPTVEDVRKQGQHQMILQAINKKQTFSELINQANSMVTSVLHDNMKRSVNVMPSQIKFGSVEQGQEAEMYLTVKNEDSLSQRIQIKAIQDTRITVKQESYGPVAPGMTKRIIVTIKANDLGKIKEEIQIMTKSDIFKVPIEAFILSHEEFAAQNNDALTKTGKSITNSRVKNRLRGSVDESRKNSVMANFKAQQEVQNAREQPQQLTKKQGSQEMDNESEDQYNNDME